MSSNPYGPKESPSVVHSEEAWLQGALIACFAYGVLFVLYCQCTYLLWKQTNRSNYKTNVSFLLFVFLVFMFSSFFTGTNMKSMQEAFIQDRNFPGGPSAFEADTPANRLGTVSTVFCQWLCDALMIWRYMMIYKGCIVPTWIVRTPPIVIFLGSIMTGIIILVRLTVASPFGLTGVDWLIPYLTVSLGLNIILTIAIVGRLLLFRHLNYSALGPSHTSDYTSVAAMVVESASLYSAFSLLILIPYVMKYSIAPIFLQNMGQAQVISTMLIVLRVASGKGWTGGALDTLAPIHFSPRSMIQTSGSGATSVPQTESLTIISCIDGLAISSRSRGASTHHGADEIDIAKGDVTRSFETYHAPNQGALEKV